MILRLSLRTYPHCLPGGLCAGLAAAHVARLPALALVAAGVAALAAALLPAESRVAALLLAVLAAGWWWGGQRLDGLDRTALAAFAGDTKGAEVVVTGPVRRGTFALRAPALVERFGSLQVRERVLIELPLGRSPPQGTRLHVVGELRLPRPASVGTFDERAWLRHQGIHVVLQARSWRAIGRRGGLASLSDRARGWLERSLAPGLRGERRAVLAGVVLGADEGLSAGLRDDFRASGLYHLLRSAC